jgi:hypothetical protein
MSRDAFTVGDLKRQLQGYSDDTVITFSGDLTFYRFKRWGDDEVILEFGEPQAFLEDAFKKKNPNVKVAFIKIDDTQWDESGIVGGPINVSVR